jgi:hypothetical protein
MKSNQLKLDRFRFGSTALLLSIVSVFLSTAQAGGVSSVGLGLSTSTALGALYQTLDSIAGVQADVLYDADMFGKNAQLRFTGNFHAHEITNLNGGHINLMGLYAGVTTPRRGDQGFQPFFGVDAGGMIDWLTFQGSVDQINAGFALSLRAVSGFDLAITQKASISVEVPLAVTFFRPTRGFLNGVVALRWKL